MSRLIRSSWLRNIGAALKTTPTTVIHRKAIHSSYTRNCSQRYTNRMKAQPLMLHAQAGILYGVSDLIAQFFVEEKSINRFDFLRTLRFFALGAVFVGPITRFWYGILDKSIRHKNPTVAIFQKVIIDQLLFRPIFLAKIIALLSIMKHLHINRVENKLRREYTDILFSNYCVWPWLQLANNFGLVPVGYRVPLTELVTVLWNVYVSWKTNKNP